jgi:hypothetical protein
MPSGCLPTAFEPSALLHRMWGSPTNLPEGGGGYSFFVDLINLKNIGVRPATRAFFS